MRVFYKDIFFDFSLLTVVNNIIKINNKDYIADSGWLLARDVPLEERDTFDLSFIIKKLNQLKKSKKLQDIILILDYNTPTMAIEINHSGNGKISNIAISASPSFLSMLEEDDVFVFICHEIGHLLDISSLIRTERFIKTYDFFTKISGISCAIALYFHLRIDLSYLALIGTIFLFFITYFSSLVFLKKLITAYLSRLGEYQADILAVKLHGDLNAVINSFKVLQELEDIPLNSGWFSTHPSVLDRINHLKRTFWFRRLINKLFK